MHRTKRKRKIIIISLIGILLTMIVGYAAFSTNLTIKGSSKVTSNWDIRITNVTDGISKGEAKNTVKPSWTAQKASMEADLYQKGDSMEYEVTIENKGSLDAKLNDILTNIKNSNSEAILITFSGYTKGEVLESGQSKKVKVKIEYNPEYEGGETSSEVEIEFDYKEESSDPEKPKTYLLTYDYKTNGGNKADITEEYVEENSQVELSNIAYKEGWSFVGWNTNKDAHEGLNSYEMPSSITTLYAIYKKDIKVKYEKGENIESISKEEDVCYIYNNEEECEVTLPEININENYIIEGWYKGEEKVGKPKDKYKIKENIVLTSKVIEDKIELTISTSSTTNSITVIASAISPSGISKYEYSIDGGKSWIEKDSNTYTFEGLKEGIEYEITVRATSETDKQATTTEKETTLSLTPPTYEEEGTTSKVVTITYPEGCGKTLTCTYQKGNGEVIEVTSKEVEVEFTEDGDIAGSVSDGINTVSSSYTVELEREISIGTVKGGSITLDKQTALLKEDVNITSTANSDFTYQGATIVCEDGSTHTITGKTFNMSICNSSVTVYPTWKKNDKKIMQLSYIPANPTWSQTLVDVGGTGVYYSSTSWQGFRYYLQFTNPQGSASRVQMATTSTIDVTDYSTLYMDTWCTDSLTYMQIGITKNRNLWMYEATEIAENVGYNITTNASSPQRISVPISGYSGDWYVNIQRLYTNSTNNHYCNVNEVGFIGMTYSYTNRGL